MAAAAAIGGSSAAMQARSLREGGAQNLGIPRGGVTQPYALLHNPP